MFKNLLTKSPLKLAFIGWLIYGLSFLILPWIQSIDRENPIYLIIIFVPIISMLSVWIIAIFLAFKSIIKEKVYIKNIFAILISILLPILVVVIVSMGITV